MQNTFTAAADGTWQLVGKSPSLVQLHDDLRQAARSDAKILITGESGAGKEIAARLVHSESRRGQKPFCAINCGGVPDSLLESELFGHVRGSFTGAYRDKAGLVEQAHGGTLFLDEVSEMSLRMQAALLRFLENGEIQPVGGSGSRHVRVDVRVVAATNRILLDCVAAKQFRADLYYRLNVIHLVVPPLRARREDVEPLVHYFLRRLSAEHHTDAPTVSRDTIDALTRHDWPGNVRELRNVVERMIVHGADAALRSEGIPLVSAERLVVLPARAGSTAIDAGMNQRLREAEVLFDRMVNRGESFWTVIYKPFMRRDLTRAHVRAVVAAGLEQTRGNYRTLITLLNMAPKDYKRFLQFLHTHSCFTPFEDLRSSNKLHPASPAVASAAAQSWATPAEPAASPTL